MDYFTYVQKITLECIILLFLIYRIENLGSEGHSNLCKKAPEFKPGA